MKSFFVLLMATLLCAGCKLLSPEPDETPGVETARTPRTVLEQADAKLAAADYSGALALYAEFVKSNPDHAQAPRARGTAAALDRLLGLRRELSERQGEVDRLKAEAAKLRADIERLRSIDLQTLPGQKK